MQIFQSADIATFHLNFSAKNDTKWNSYTRFCMRVLLADCGDFFKFSVHDIFSWFFCLLCIIINGNYTVKFLICVSCLVMLLFSGICKNLTEWNLRKSRDQKQLKRRSSNRTKKKMWNEKFFIPGIIAVVSQKLQMTL